METKTLYVVQYDDCYESNVKLEVIVESQEGFLRWLDKHNEDRRMNDINADNFVEETEEDFTLIPLNLVTFKK